MLVYINVAAVDTAVMRRCDSHIFMMTISIPHERKCLLFSCGQLLMDRAWNNWLLLLMMSLLIKSRVSRWNKEVFLVTQILISSSVLMRTALNRVKCRFLRIVVFVRTVRFDRTSLIALY